jgi:hypothetical protein
MIESQLILDFLDIIANPFQIHFTPKSDDSKLFIGKIQLEMSVNHTSIIITAAS